MITVRFRSGYAVTYSDATYVDYNGINLVRLFTKKDGRWVCDIMRSSGCLIEARKPCSITQPGTGMDKQLEEAERKRDKYYNWYKDEHESCAMMGRSISALRGVITKLKQKNN